MDTGIPLKKSVYFVRITKRIAATLGLAWPRFDTTHVPLIPVSPNGPYSAPARLKSSIDDCIRERGGRILRSVAG
jgi:hypothetical protein